MKYPTQYEAQAILDAMEAIDSVYTGGCWDCKTAQILSQAREEINKEYIRTFDSPETSPWSVMFKGKNRTRAIYWNHESAAAKAA